MPSTTLPPNSFVYVDNDVADGETLVQWRHRRERRRRENGRARRSFHLLRLRTVR